VYASKTASPTGRGTAWSLRGMVTLAACLTVIAFAAAAEAGLELWPNGSDSGLGSFLPTSGRSSLLDPSKLGISHQMMFSYSSGSVAKNNVGGLWLTNFSYKFSSPLTMDLSVGASLSSAGTRQLNAQSLFVESFSLRYRPSENFYFQFMYREAPNTWFLLNDDRMHW